MPREQKYNVTGIDRARYWFSIDSGTTQTCDICAQKNSLAETISQGINDNDNLLFSPPNRNIEVNVAGVFGIGGRF